MKTAMQELIDKLEEHLVQSARGQLGTNRGGDYRIGLRKAIDFANEELEKEKEQIMAAKNDPTLKSPLDYYNQTYNQNK